MKQIHTTCDPIIKEYEDSFATYKQTSRDIAKAQASLFDKLTNKDLSIPDDEFSSYDPNYISMTKGGSEYVFTETDVQQFFEKELGS